MSFARPGMVIAFGKCRTVTFGGRRSNTYDFRKMPLTRCPRALTMNNTVVVVAVAVGEGVVVGDAVADEEDETMAEEEAATMADEEAVVVELDEEDATMADEEVVLEEDVQVGGDEDAEPIRVY
mmetsp:Transcript_17775/g.32177  ORF Transcript_17775/g.32177 Transcript_17775/m.32177 type:complete len:124 (-) Transcript_17775:218-589(-)